MRTHRVPPWRRVRGVGDMRTHADLILVLSLTNAGHPSPATNLHALACLPDWHGRRNGNGMDGCADVGFRFRLAPRRYFKKSTRPVASMRAVLRRTRCDLRRDAHAEWIMTRNHPC